MKLLTDEELKNQVGKTIEDAGIQRISFGEARDKLFNLIMTQKKAYAEYVIGEDEPETLSDFSYGDRNGLRAEQRKKLAELFGREK